MRHADEYIDWELLAREGPEKALALFAEGARRAMKSADHDGRSKLEAAASILPAIEFAGRFDDLSGEIVMLGLHAQELTVGGFDNEAERQYVWDEMDAGLGRIEARLSEPLQ